MCRMAHPTGRPPNRPLEPQDKALDARTSKITALYCLLDEAGVSVPAEDRAALSTLGAAYGALRAAAEEVEAGKEAASARYLMELEAGEAAGWGDRVWGGGVRGVAKGASGVAGRRPLAGPCGSGCNHH